MSPEERMQIIELAWDLVEARKPEKPTKTSIESWAELFDQAYKTILKTAQS